ncbi:hypothetical protein M9435_000274 [Picochlorum sp. BPE23]|nr:hypothetical protein M9435_000274 [Picochlorum sp. BPE23]
MCRLMAYVGPEILVADVVLWPSRSIIKQSYEARERRNDSSLPCHLGYGNLNGDGFGIGWYSPCSMNDASPCTFTSVTPAWNNDNLNRLAMKLKSGLIFAHVRAAYPGMPVSEQNCHPFAHENYLFMHNGVVAGFLDIRRQLISIMNDEAYNAVQSFHSDSAVCFGLFLHHLPDTKKRQTPEVLLRAIQATVSTITRVQKENGIEGTSLLNFVVTDGVTTVATRYADDPDTIPASLYYAEGYSYDRSQACHATSLASQASKTIHSSSQPSGSATGKRGGAVIGEGNYGLSYAGSETRVCLVASEPVTDCTSDWNAVEPNTALVISKDSKGILTVFKAWLANEGEHPDNEEVYRCLETVDEKLVDGGLDAAHSGKCKKGILRSGSLKSGSGGTTPRGGGENDLRLDDAVTPRSIQDPCHVLSGHRGPVTTVKSNVEYLFSGGADGLIRVWALSDYTCIKTLQGHRDPIRRIDFAGEYLMSAGAETIRLWDLKTFECISVVKTNSKASVTALACDASGAAFVGSVDCRIKKYSPESLLNTSRDNRIEKKKLRHPLFGRDKDLDKFSLSLEKNRVDPICTTFATKGHCSSVTCLSVCDDVVCSGSHDSTIRVWSAEDLSFQKVLRGHRGSVLALTRIKGFLLSGGRDSVVRVWDLETWVCCDILRGHESSVLSISAHEGLGMFASSSADGTVRLWDLQTLSCLKVFEAIPRMIGFDSLYYHAPPCMACVISPPYVIVCSDDGEISLHDACVCDGDDELEIEENGIIRSKTPDIIRRVPSRLDTTSAAISARIEREFEKSLRSFIKIQTVSADPGRKQDCFQGAKFLLRLLESIGAEVKLAPTMEGKNPLVMGRIGNDPALKTITFYGHYDVQPAMEPDWSHYPFELHAKDGYYIGRGVSDNKGPILAFIFAVREMLEELRYSEDGSGKMPVNVAFLFEGEEENGSIGFKEAVQDNIRWFEGTEAIFISNTLWVGEAHPCITYGMRGMMNMSVEIRGPAKDLHSGNEGGVFSEPLADLTKLLASLVDSRSNVCVPGFYEDVKESCLDIAMQRLEDSNEFSLEGYRAYLGVKELTVGRTEEELLWARWCQPTLSVVDVRVGTAEDEDTAHYRFGPTRFSVIPRAAVGKVSVRFVPNQDSESIIKRLTDHLKHEFAKLRSGNSIKITVHSVGDWWEADPNCKLVKLAESAIQDVWKETPLLVREGGTMPVASALEKLLHAPALLLPMGQSSDNCHLSNERIRRLNLFRGKSVIKHLLKSFDKK